MLTEKFTKCSSS